MCAQAQARPFHSSRMRIARARDARRRAAHSTQLAKGNLAGGVTSPARSETAKVNKTCSRT
jgi:hypothetical protein